MDEQYLDASQIDEFNDYDLTGDYEEGDQFEQTTEPSSEENSKENDSSETQSTSSLSEPDNSEDLTSEVLRLKGISDPTKIKFEDESGAIVEKSWDDLSKTEQLNILTSSGDPDTDLEDDEIELINDIRRSGLSINEYFQNVQNLAVEHMQSLQPRTYEIDKLEDDELFALDLLEKIGEENITDEELHQAILDAKNNEVLYQKQVAALRQLYKALEDENIIRQQQAQVEAEEEKYQNFSNQILSEIEGFNQVAGEDIELSVDDMNDLANYILTRDETGTTPFGYAMNNPRTFTTVAFWALKGPEIMQELQLQIQEAYKRGFNEGKGSAPRANKLVILPHPTSTPTTRPASVPQYKSTFADASSALGEDESYLNY